MRFIVPLALLIAALIHALPLLGVLGATKLESLYGIAVQDANLEILMRHRAVLFGMLAAFLGYAAFKPSLHRLALVGGLASVVSFLVLAFAVGGYNTALSTVIRADILALVALLIGGAAQFLVPLRANVQV